MSIKKSMAGAMVATLLSVSIIGVASAASLNTNGSFEDGVEPGDFTVLSAGDTTSISDWSVVSGSVDYIGTHWTASEGSRSLDMSGNEAGAVSQTFETMPGHTYTVTFDLAGNPEGGPVVKTLAVDAGDTPTVYTFDTTGHTVADMGWMPQTYTFTAADSTTTLTFTSMDDGFFGPALDNVMVSDTLTAKDQCKNGGWMAYEDPSFKNQGDCVSYQQSSPNATGNKTK